MFVSLVTIQAIHRETGIHKQTIMAALLGTPPRSRVIRPILAAALERRGLSPAAPPSGEGAQ